MDLKQLRDKISKQAKGAHIAILSDSDIASSKEMIPTPAYDLNRILSGSLFNGLPSKTLTLLIGPEASGKSSLMCLCLAEAQRKGYKPVIIDTEGAWDKDFVKRWGLNPDEILYIYTPWVDQVCVILANLIDSGDTKLAIAVDSVGGLEKKKLFDDSLDGTVKADQGTLQKEIKRMLKLLLNVCKGQDSIGLMGGHYYGNPTGYGEADKVGGGHFAKLAPDIIIALKNSKVFEDPKAAVKDRVIIGNKITAITIKNRYYPPFNEATIDINYRDGINAYAGMLEIAIKAELIEQAGAWYNFPDGTKQQGAINALASLNGNTELLDKIDKWLKSTGYSTINSNVADAIALTEINPYNDEETPVKSVRKKGKK